jgi:hypothetical protein
VPDRVLENDLRTAPFCQDLIMKCLRVWSIALRTLGLALLLHSSAQADIITVSINNPGNSSFSLTPLWYGFHSGGFDVFSPGERASASLEALAEDGIVSGLQSDFSSMAPSGQQGVLTAPGGFPGAPVIEPGETATFSFNREASNRFFSFASMIIPSNDAFIGAPDAIEIFNADGSFVGGGNSRTLTIAYENIWDAGTEVNNTFGAAFSTVGGVASDENGFVNLLPSGGLDNFLNTGTAAGTTITQLFTPGSTVATITISSVPEPSSMALLGITCATIFVSRRRVSKRS